MTHNASLSRALEAVETLSQPHPAWLEVLQSAKTLIGADSAVFLMFDLGGSKPGAAGAPIEFEHCNVDPGVQGAYVNHFFRHDIITPHAMKLPEGAWLDTVEHYSEAALSRMPYYVDFMCRYRMRQMFTFVLEQGTVQQSAVTFHRAVPVDGARHRLESQPIRTFTDALRQAVARRRQAARWWLDASESTFDSFGEATWLVTPTGTIISMSTQAHALMDTGVGPSLRAQNRRIWHSDTRVREALAAALIAASHGDQPVKLAVRRPAGGPDIFEMVRADSRVCLGNEALVLIRQRRRLASGDVPIDALCAAFPITQAEARVLAALMSGKLLKEHACDQNVSIHTVRTQVASLKEKMNCTRQVDLVRLAAALL
jgi:DNA-binding CsgD family transcriptional regulator